MKEDILKSFAKNCVICVAAGISVTIAIKYFKGSEIFSDFDPLNLINKFHQFDQYERKIMSSSILASNLKYGKEDIVGQNELIEQIMSTIVIPIKYNYKFKKGDIDLPKGVLLFGPPGCGKTMLAQAIAKELNVSFINIGLDVIQDKWYGETTKIVKALFTLAKKIKPCVIFIDEIDSVLANRSSEDHEASKGYKSTFLQLWDGLFTDDEDCILIIGATNRRELLDDAFASRFDQSYHLPLPNVEQRKLFLEKRLSNIANDDFNYELLAEKTENFSFRDLKSLCKMAKSKRIPSTLLQSIVMESSSKGSSSDASQSDKSFCDLPKLELSHFDSLLTHDKFRYIRRKL